MKETKKARNERQQQEEWQMIEVLRGRGNLVEPEYELDPERKWKIDYLLNGERAFGHPVALEIEGYGRHQSWAGWHADVEKYNAIAARGWRLVRVTRDMVGNGDALEALARCGVPVEPSGLDGHTYKVEG